MLHKYNIDFSALTTDERSELVDRIESMSFNGLFWYSGFQCADFFIDEDFDVNYLKIPDICHLTQVYQ
jgi:hypothetical protein